MNFKFVVLIVVGLLFSQARADFSGVIYEKDSQKKKELFKIQVEEKSDKENVNVKSTFKDSDGVVAIEQSVTLHGDDIVRDEVEQKQLGQKGLIEVKEDQIFFSKTVKGETKVKKREKGRYICNLRKFSKIRSQSLV
jgi:hypothetical protein